MEGGTEKRQKVTTKVKTNFVYCKRINRKEEKE